MMRLTRSVEHMRIREHTCPTCVLNQTLFVHFNNTGWTNSCFHFCKMSSNLYNLYLSIMLASFTLVILIKAESFSDETSVFPPLENFDKGKYTVDYFVNKWLKRNLRLIWKRQDLLIQLIIRVDQIESNQQELKSIVLKISEPCKTLHDHLKSTPESLDWITKQGTETMLHLAILLDKAFNRELLSMILRN